jgi:hypothetical protein
MAFCERGRAVLRNWSGDRYQDGPKGFGSHSDQEQILLVALYQFMRFKGGSYEVGRAVGFGELFGSARSLAFGSARAFLFVFRSAREIDGYREVSNLEGTCASDQQSSKATRNRFDTSIREARPFLLSLRFSEYGLAYR